MVVAFRVLQFGYAHPHTILPFKKLEEVKKVVGSSSVIVAVEDDLANQWAVYFLREVPIYLAEYRVYMAQNHVVPYMDRAMPINLAEARYFLSDLEGLSASFLRDKALWSGGPYFLWAIPPENWIIITGVRNENGVEKWGGQMAFWMGKGDSEISLLSLRSGEASLQGHFIPGPSLPDYRERRLLIRRDGGFERIITLSQEGEVNIPVPVVSGKNRFILRPLDRPTLARLPSGDGRPMLIGILGLKIAMNAPGSDPLKSAR